MDTPIVVDPHAPENVKRLVEALGNRPDFKDLLPFVIDCMTLADDVGIPTPGGPQSWMTTRGLRCA